MFSHRHISQRKPDFIGCINSEVGRMGSHGQKQPLRSRLITIHQPVGKSVLLCIQQIIIIGSERRAIFTLRQQFPYFSERPKYISESNAKDILALNRAYCTIVTTNRHSQTANSRTIPPICLPLSPTSTNVACSYDTTTKHLRYRLKRLCRKADNSIRIAFLPPKPPPTP